MRLTSLVLVRDARPPTFPVSSPGCGKDRAARVGQAAAMHFVGVDLAWGDRKPTGLAVLDGDGYLLHVSAASTDDAIVAALAPYVEGDCLVAIDAPLIVTNATGNRPAEAALNKDFARFDAGAHPSNTGKPEFREQPRGARIAARLGLDINPRSGRRPPGDRGLPAPGDGGPVPAGPDAEVQEQARARPRAAPLRADRAVRSARGARERRPSAPCGRHTRPTGGTATAWQALRTAVETAGRKSELRVVEDQVDAVICAYVALFATREPERTTTYGDFETGYIVTPTLPDDLMPTPRGPRIAPDGQRPRRLRGPRVRRAAARAAAGGRPVRAAGDLDPRRRRHQLPERDRPREVRGVVRGQGRPHRRRPAFVHRPAARDHRPDRGPGDHLRAQRRPGRGRPARRPGRRPRRPRHGPGDGERGPVRLRQPAPARRPRRCARENQPAYELLRGRQAQVQIRTVLQHAWAEFEHDIRYKGTIPDEHVPDFDRRFTLAAGLLELADREFSTIRDRLRTGMTGPSPEPQDDDPRISPRELAAFLPGSTPMPAGRGPTTTRGSPGCSSSWASRPWPSSATRCARWTRRRSRDGWTTATRRARCGGSTTPCSGRTATVRRAARQRRPGAGLRARLEKLPARTGCAGSGRTAHGPTRSQSTWPVGSRPSGRSSRAGSVGHAAGGLARDAAAAAYRSRSTTATTSSSGPITGRNSGSRSIGESTQSIATRRATLARRGTSGCLRRVRAV